MGTERRAAVDEVLTESALRRHLAERARLSAFRQSVQIARYEALVNRHNQELRTCLK